MVLPGVEAGLAAYALAEVSHGFLFLLLFLLALLLAAFSLLLALYATVFLCSRLVEALQLARPVRPLLLLDLLVDAPVPLFLLRLLFRHLLALLGGERGVHLCDFGVVFGKVLADAEAVGVAAGSLEHELCAGECGAVEADSEEHLDCFKPVPALCGGVFAFHDFHEIPDDGCAIASVDSDLADELVGELGALGVD